MKFKTDWEKRYPICIEVAGEQAMFSRSDTGSERMSSPCPTRMAAKAIFETVVFMEQVIVIPLEVRVCRPLQYMALVTNSNHSPLRKSSLRTDDNPMQIRENTLVDVCYQIIGIVMNNPDEEVLSRIPEKHRGNNHAHAYHDRFKRYLRQGRSLQQPCLGRNNMPASYWGPFRAATMPDASVNEEILLMVESSFDKLVNGTKCEPYYVFGLKIQNGVLRYDSGTVKGRAGNEFARLVEAGMA